MIADAVRYYILAGMLEMALSLTFFSEINRAKLVLIRANFNSSAAFWLTMTMAVSLYSLVWLPCHLFRRSGR